MKIKRKISAAVLFFSVAALTYVIVFNAYVRKNNDSLSEVTTAEETTVVYVLKEYNGKIAVFISKSDEPIEVLDSNFESLPDEDRKLLEEGVTAFSKSSLQRIIEDYTS